MKNNQLAEDYLKKANDCLSLKEYTEALKYYNKALCWVDDSQTNTLTLLSDAYYGRAKVYYDVNQFKLCSENAQCAIFSVKNDCEEKLKIYKQLRDDCEEILRNISSENEKTTSFFQLSQPAKQKMPFIAESLEIFENEEYGRFIATRNDLKTGDIVVIEEPFYKVLSPELHFLRCAICLKENMLNLLPCSTCLAMFCSKKCQKSIIHNYECKKVEKYPKEESFEKLLLQRMFYQAIEITGSLKELQKLVNKQITSSKTIMDFDFSNPNDPMYEKNRLLATTSLAEREPWNAAIYAKYECVTTQLMTENEEERAFLRSYLVRCLKSMTVNFFHFFWDPEQFNGQAYGLCSLSAYFAHSCDPNVDKIDVDNKFLFIVRKPIKAGEKLFMNYDRFSFLTHSLEQRKSYFNKVYTFDCACSACVNNFPQLDSLLRKFNFEDLAISDDLVKNAKEKYKKNCTFIQENSHKNYPCFEICSLMVQNIKLLHLIGKKLPF